MKPEDLLPSKAGCEAIERSIKGTAEAMLKKFGGPSMIPGCTCSLRVQKQVLAANDTSLHWCTCPATRVEPMP